MAFVPVSTTHDLASISGACRHTGGLRLTDQGGGRHLVPNAPVCAGKDVMVIER